MGITLILLVVAAALIIAMKYSQYKKHHTHHTSGPRTVQVDTIPNLKPVTFFSQPCKFVSRVPNPSEIETNEEFYIRPYTVEFRERRGGNVLAIAVSKVKNDIVRWVEVPITNEQMVELVEGEVELNDFLDQIEYDSFIIADVDLDGKPRTTWKFGYGESIFISDYTYVPYSSRYPYNVPWI